MRHSRVACLVVSLIGAVLLSAKAKPPISVVVSPSSQTVKTGASVLLKVTLTNTSKQDLAFYDGNPFCDYPITIRDSDGNEPPETAYNRESKCNKRPDGEYVVVSRNIFRVLKRGESQSGEINTANYYDLRRTGRYTIQLFRHLPATIAEQDIAANSVTATVTE